MTDWAYQSVDTALAPEQFIGLWNQRGALLTQAVNDKQRKLVVDIRDFGSVGGGNNDDQSSIARAGLQSGGAVLFFPPPKVKYVISSTIALADNTRVEGAGWPEIHQSTVGSAGFVPGNDCEICYLSFTGTGATSAPFFGRGFIYNDPNGTGLIGQRLDFHHLKFDATVGTSCISGNNFIDAKIHDCYFALSGNAEHGIYCSSGSRRVSIWNHYMSKSAAAVSPTLAIDIKGSDSIWIDRVYMTGAGWDNGGIALNTAASTRASLTRLYFVAWSNATVPIVIGNASADSRVSVDDVEMDGGSHALTSKGNGVTINNLRAWNTVSTAVEIDGTGAIDASRTVVQNCKTFGCGGGQRVVNADTDTYLLNNINVGTGAGNGIDYDSGSAIGLIDGNVNRNFGTAIRNPAGCPVGTNF